jgi:hypothetical protein
MTRRISEMYGGMKCDLRQTLERCDNASDPKVKLQGVSIANDCYKFIPDMSPNVGIISDTLKYVTQMTEQLDTTKYRWIYSYSQGKLS